jgi:hypothetical protein
MVEENSKNHNGIENEDEIKENSGLMADVAETVKDPFCDEDNPRVITFQDVCQAAFMIKGGVERTDCTVSENYYNFKQFLNFIKISART